MSAAAGSSSSSAAVNCVVNLGSSSANCAFCRGSWSEVDCGKLTIIKMGKSRKIVAHFKCLQYSSNLYQEENASWDPQLVDKELARIKNLKCSSCKALKKEVVEGAGSGCAFARWICTRE